MHQVIHACAGAGKTQHIIDRCKNEPQKRRLILTLTTSGQDELKRRLFEALPRDACQPEVIGWYSFLIRHVVRPYLPLLFRDKRVTGLLYTNPNPKFTQKKPKKSPLRYFTSNGQVYKDYLEELGTSVMNKAPNLVENRLAAIYEELLIDEVQDISRAGLDVLEKLLQQKKMPCIFVGDCRQSMLDSSLAVNKNASADRLNLLEWFNDKQKTTSLEVVHLTDTYRSNQAIANFSDTITSTYLSVHSTHSQNLQTTEHDGVFLVAEKDFDAYHKKYSPQVLREKKTSWTQFDDLNPLNFGVVKGQTFERVAILSTDPILEFCVKKKPLTPKSACAFYVAVTRAKYSVAIVVKAKDTHRMNKRTQGIFLWPASETDTV